MMRWLAVVLWFVAAMAMAKDAEAPTAPYEVELWAKGAYDPTGRLRTLAFDDATSYPAAFLARMETQLRQQPIEPKLADGVPATFDTAIVVRVTVTPKPGGADARIDGIDQVPGVVRRAVVRYPRELAAIDGWKGVVLVQCTVSIAGRCGPVEVVGEDPGMPEVGRRFAKDSLARWVFEPQRVGGKPIPSVIRMPIRLETTNSLPPKKFGK